MTAHTFNLNDANDEPQDYRGALAPEEVLWFEVLDTFIYDAVTLARFKTKDALVFSDRVLIRRSSFLRLASCEYIREICGDLKVPHPNFVKYLKEIMENTWQKEVWTFRQFIARCNKTYARKEEPWPRNQKQSRKRKLRKQRCLSTKQKMAP